MWVLGIEPGPLEEQSVILTTEPFLQPIFYNFEPMNNRLCGLTFLPLDTYILLVVGVKKKIRVRYVCVC